MSSRTIAAGSPSSQADRSSVPRRIGLVIAGSAVLALAAHVAVPFWPVPLTLQTLAVLTLGLVAGPRLAAGMVLAYIIEGCFGLPVFAHGVGPAVLAGPTGGFILGFLPAAVLAGMAERRGLMASFLPSLAVLVAADAVIFMLGVGWLSALIGFEKAVVLGLLPFLTGEAVKIALVATGVQLWARRR